MYQHVDGPLQRRSPVLVKEAAPIVHFRTRSSGRPKSVERICVVRPDRSATTNSRQARLVQEIPN